MASTIFVSMSNVMGKRLGVGESSFLTPTSRRWIEKAFVGSLKPAILCLNAMAESVDFNVLALLPFPCKCPRKYAILRTFIGTVGLIPLFFQEV